MRALKIATIAGLAALAAGGTAAANELRIALNEATSVQLPRPAKGVAIGNPDIAGVTVQDDRLLFVTGKSYGSTNLIVVGENGQTVLRTRVRVVAEESEAVILTRGTQTVRLDCAPECRSRAEPTINIGGGN